MRRQDMIVLAIALLAGLVAFFIVAGILSKSSKPKTTVIVAARPISKDAIIVPEDITNSPPIEQALTPAQMEDLFLQGKDVVGNQAIGDIPQGTAVKRSGIKAPEKKLVEQKEEGISVPPGKRSLNLYVNEIENVPYELKEGDFIDVIGNVATFDGKMEQQPIVRDIQVRAIYKDDLTGEIKSVAIILSPRATDAVTRASKRGKVRFVIRAEGEGKEDIVNEYIGYVEIIKGVFKEKVSRDQSSYYQDDSVSAIQKINPFQGREENGPR